MSAETESTDVVETSEHRYFDFPELAEPLVPIGPPRTQIYLPVSAMYCNVVDVGGDVIAMCFTPELAERVAYLLNNDAALATTR